MKIKADFVTNSSSTSFVIADHRKNTDGKIKVSIETDISDLVTNTISTIEALDIYYSDTYGVDDVYEMRERVFEEYKGCKKIIESGSVVHIMDICSDSGESTETFLYEQGIKNKDLQDNNIEVIRG